MGWLGGLALLAAIFWFSPTEQTLGAGIKWVYLHVACIWTALLVLSLTGGLGAIEIFAPRPTLSAWREALSWNALLWLILAVVMSLIAQRVNWNGIFWDEPRMQALLRAWALWTLTHFAVHARPATTEFGRRWRGGLMALMMLVVILPMQVSPLVMHPENPIGTSSSLAIRATFGLLFVVCALGAARLTWVVRQRLAR